MGAIFFHKCVVIAIRVSVLDTYIGDGPFKITFFH